MPFAYGTLGAHDDVNHYGSAKRDTASGVAGLDSSGHVLGKGNILKLPRSGANNIAMFERTSGENALILNRVAADDYDCFVVESSVNKQVQTESMKDVASGIAGLDASAKVPTTSLYTNVASGIMGLDAQKLMGGGNIAGFNLLKIYSTNVFNETLVGTGNVIESLANGTVQITCPANNDDADFLENAFIALSGLPRVLVFRVNSITLLGAATTCGFGLASSTLGTGQEVVVLTEDGGTNWQFRTFLAAATNTAIAAVAAGDVFVFYCIAGRCTLFKNGVELASHNTNVPTAAIGHNAFIATAAGQGAGSELTLGFMS